VQYRGNVHLRPKSDESKKKPGPLLLVYFMMNTLSPRRMICLLPPLCRQHVASISYSSCVSPTDLTYGRVGEEPNQKSWSSIIYLKLPDSYINPFFFHPFSLPHTWPHSISPLLPFLFLYLPPFSFRTYPITRGQLVKWWVGWD
jgi:hypothetical protein